MEWLESLQKEAPTRVAVREMSKLLVDELRMGAPVVDWNDASHREHFASLYEPQGWTLSEAAVAEALRHLNWELDRDFEAIDHYARNRLLEARCPDVSDRLTSEFLRHYLHEAFMQLIEATENRISRQDIRDGLSELESRLIAN